jgi:hypothetical protein
MPPPLSAPSFNACLPPTGCAAIYVVAPPTSCGDECPSLRLRSSSASSLSLSSPQVRATYCASISSSLIFPSLYSISSHSYYETLDRKRKIWSCIALRDGFWPGSDPFRSVAAPRGSAGDAGAGSCGGAVSLGGQCGHGVPQKRSRQRSRCVLDSATS